MAESGKAGRAAYALPFVTFFFTLVTCICMGSMPIVQGGVDAWFARQGDVSVTTNTVVMLLPWMWLPAFLVNILCTVVTLWFSWWIWNHRENNDVDALVQALKVAKWESGHNAERARLEAELVNKIHAEALKQDHVAPVIDRVTKATADGQWHRDAALAAWVVAHPRPV